MESAIAIEIAITILFFYSLLMTLFFYLSIRRTKIERKYYQEEIRNKREEITALKCAAVMDSKTIKNLNDERHRFQEAMRKDGLIDRDSVLRKLQFITQEIVEQKYKTKR